MLKHVQISPMRSRSDSLSMRSSTSCASSLCGSPEPLNEHLRSHSRASSYSSLNETIPQTTIKIYTACLRQDIEYKTLGISYDATSKSVVQQLLRRCKMRHRDPRLFYLTMEVTVRRPGVKSVLELDDEARPALLQACHPKGDSRFCLQQKPGGLIRVHTSVLQPNSQYKSLLISEDTTSDELLSLLLSCYNSAEPVEQFSLYEVCPGQEYQRKLHPDDLPLKTQLQRQQKNEIMHFLVRRNPNYPRRRQMLAPISESKHFIIGPGLSNHHRLSLHSTTFPLTAVTTPTNTFISDIVDGVSSLNILSETSKGLALRDSCPLSTSSLPSKSKCPNNERESHTTNNNNNNDDTSCCLQCRSDGLEVCEHFQRRDPADDTTSSSITVTPPAIKGKNADRCSQAPPRPSKASLLPSLLTAPNVPSYSPVYNIREIRTVCHSFSSLGIDKKLAEIDNSSGGSNSIVKEAVNTDPIKGVGNFIYI
ncbi:uncharacterized protein LOC129778994 [Toxorhynchites rutilus septentrionalis]|uniref:uncharacterized protein LOC129778994 n=1 Tax=Toxorhynchites rutilus septentrionalis TaxID=329112 RepID=UPI002478FA04|nr:uncharacterized protein LOC129778994 [Toxorhynchites rutilus septentrionalis]